MIRPQQKWQPEKLGEIVLFKTGKLDSNAAVLDGKYPFFTCSQETLRTNTFSFDTECVLLGGNNAAGIFPLKYFKGKFDAYQRTYVITPRNSENLDTRFLYYALRPKLAEFRSVSTGAATKFLTLGILNETLLHIPPFKTQCRIAAILGAYDDLIEINRRRITVLEEMARGLFTEWFICLRFPGYDSVAIKDTPDGPLPAGWTWGRFADLACEVRDTVSPEAVDPAMPYVGLEHFSRRSTTLAECGSAADVSSLKARFRRGDILFGKIRPYFHKVAWAPFDGVASTDAIIWRPMPGLAAQALLQASDDAFVAHSVQTSNGTKMPRANSKVLADYRCALASSNLSDRFEETVRPMIDFAAALQASNANLATARDLLLPRLISGQLSITEAEQQLDAA